MLALATYWHKMYLLSKMCATKTRLLKVLVNNVIFINFLKYKFVE